MSTRKLLLASLLCITANFVQAQRYIEQQTQYTLQTLQKGVTQELANRRKANISQVKYNLTFNIPANQQENVTGSAVISFVLKERDDVVLDFQGLFSGACLINGKKRVATYKEEHIVLPMKQMTSGLNTVELSFVCKNTALNRHPNYLYTLFIPDHAHSCFPCFDQPNMTAHFTTKLNIPEGWKSMACDSTSLLSPHFYSFVAGQFLEKKDLRDGHSIRALYLETDPLKTEQLDNIFSETAHALSWMESYTGIKCPYKEYGMIILPKHQYGGIEHPGAIQLSDKRLFLNQHPSQEELLCRAEYIAHETAHLWFGNITSLKVPEEVWAKEVLANFMASKITRREFSKMENELNFMRTYQAHAIAIDRTDGTHPIAQSLTSQNETALLHDNILYDKATVMMRMMEQLMGNKKLQSGLQKFLRKFYFKQASWDDLIGVLDHEVPTANIRQMSEAWTKQKGMPIIHTTYQDGKLIVSQSDLSGERPYWRQKFDIRIINDLGSSRTITVDMQQPAMTYELSQAPSYIIPNYDGHGYGRFTLDETYTNKLAQRLIVTRDDLQRYILLQTLHDNYLMGRIAPSYFGELYRDMMKEKNPLIIQTCIDHMFKIAFNQPDKERQTLELCIMDLIPENHHSECRRAIIRKLASNATSPEVLDQLYQLWSDHNDPLFDAHDYMEMAYHLAIMRPEEWQRIIDTERQYLTDDILRQEFDYISRACSPDVNTQVHLFNELLMPENRQLESWAIHTLRLLNADVREPASNVYIPSSLASLEYLHQTGGIFISDNWLYALLSGHKSQEARQQIELFLREHPNFPPLLRNKILEAAWPLMNNRKEP